MRFLADENFDNDILRGILRENPDFDVIRVQNTEIYEAEDPSVLAWAAKAGRILLTHDVNTLIDFAYDRVRAGLPMPGVFEVRKPFSTRAVITALMIIDGASDADEWENQITYIPLR
jgi:predicted nuclease of predicted toxin-antitoxin system